MKVVCISDTHNELGQFSIPDGDVLVHAGDFSMMGRPEEVHKYLQVDLPKLPHKYKVIIAGNHDFMCEQDPYMFQSMIPDGKGIYYLEDNLVNLDGVNFYGAPWIHNLPTWAFNEDDAQKRLEKWQKIPDETDVLVTHGPPLGLGDTVLKRNWVGQQVGCPHLLNEVVERIKPKFHVYGHIHEGHGAHRVDGCDTQFINASILDERYDIRNNPVVFHIGED